MLKRTLEQNYIDYEEILVESKSRDELLEMGISSVPVTFVGQERFVGATSETIKKIIAKVTTG